MWERGLQSGYCLPLLFHCGPGRLAVAGLIDDGIAGVILAGLIRAVCLWMTEMAAIGKFPTAPLAMNVKVSSAAC